jgi:histidine ammonia-lyase
MTAIGALALVDAAELLAPPTSSARSASTRCSARLAASDPRIHAGKPHPGQQRSAEILRGLVAGSPLNDSHRDCGQVQDAYALRCMPQVHGAVRGALAYVGGGAAHRGQQLHRQPAGARARRRRLRCHQRRQLPRRRPSRSRSTT